MTAGGRRRDERACRSRPLWRPPLSCWVSRPPRHIHDRTHLDDAVCCRRDHRGVVDRIIEAGAVEDIKPAELLLGFGEWAVQCFDAPIANTDSGCGRARFQRLTRDKDAVLCEMLIGRLV